MKKIYSYLKNRFHTSPLPFGKGAGVGLLFLLAFLLAKSHSTNVETYKQTKILMGTVVEIQVRDSDKDKAELAISKAFNEIKRIDDLFSSYKENSQVWKLNEGSKLNNEISDELYDLFSFSDSIWKVSDGAFDVSFGNVIELWQFKSENPSAPNSSKLKDALENSGWENVQLKKGNQLEIAKKVKFDFGAFAKGYAVDKAVEVIKQCGVNNALVNAGGEVKSLGNNWIVGIQHPRKKNEIISKINLSNISAATSGDYEQYFEVNGKRYHHILNPKTGMPANGCQSVTIICKENKLADALATAVFVIGKKKGMKLIESLENVEGMIIDSSGQIFSSTGFSKHLVRS